MKLNRIVVHLSCWYLVPTRADNDSEVYKSFLCVTVVWVVKQLGKV